MTDEISVTVYCVMLVGYNEKNDSSVAFRLHCIAFGGCELNVSCLLCV